MGGETHGAEIPSKVVLADYDRSGSVFCNSKGYEAFVGRATWLEIHVGEEPVIILK